MKVIHFSNVQHNDYPFDDFSDFEKEMWRGTDQQKVGVLLKRTIEKESAEVKVEPKDFFPGFIVTCAKCNRQNVYVDNTIGFSESSGTWGSVDLVCPDCDNRCLIMKPY